MKLILAASFLFAASCARFELRVANASGQRISKVEIRSLAGSTQLESLEAGATHIQPLKLKTESDINVNYTDARGLQFYSSAPFKVGPKDSGFLLLSVTAKGSLDAVDGRKK